MAPRDDVHVFYQMTVDETSDHPLLVVAAAVTDPPPISLEWGRVDSPDDISNHVGPSLLWAATSLLAGRLYVAAGATIMLLDQMARPSVDFRQVRVTTGRLELTPVVMQGGTIRSSATKMDWETEVIPEALATTAEIAAEVRRNMSRADLPPDIVIALGEWYDVIRPPAFDQINPQLRKSQDLLPCR